MTMHFHVANDFTVHVAPGSDLSWGIYNAGNGPGVACDANDCYACDCKWTRRNAPVPENKRTNVNGPPCTECKSKDKHCSCDEAYPCNGLKITFNKIGEQESYCLSCAVKRGMHISACRCP